MPLGSSGNQFTRNPFAPGGSMYGQNTTDAYNNGAMVGVPPGLTNWNYKNPYAAGGLNFGQPAQGTVVTSQNNNTQRQIDKAYQRQLADRQTQAAPTGPTSSLLDQLLKGLGGGSSGRSVGGSSGSGGGMGTVSSNIDVGPIWSPSQTASGEAAIRNGASVPAPQSTNVASGAQGTLDRMFADTMRQNSAQDATDFARSAAYANAQQDLASQKAHAQSGLGSAELLARLQAQQYQQQAVDNNWLYQLLGGLV